MYEIEEIAEQASIDNLGRISPAFEIGYIVGTNDAINKACEWLKKNAIKYAGMFTSHTEDDYGIERIEVRNTINMQLFDDFRKAMKGE